MIRRLPRTRRCCASFEGLPHMAGCIELHRRAAGMPGNHAP